MALDFHNIDDRRFLFDLDDKKLKNLSEIFTEFEKWTSIFIDPYGDTKLTVENQKVIIKIIDEYIIKTNLNLDKQKTLAIIEFKTLLTYFSKKNYTIEILGD